jgi:NADH-quinone oxidoreductase subunit C
MTPLTAAQIIEIVETALPGKVAEKKLDTIDPWIAVAPEHLLAVGRFLRDDPRLKFEMLNCISGVDYFEPDPKKAPKASFQPHMEVVYHLQSFTHKHRIVVKVMLPRWKDDKPGQLPEVPSVVSLWGAADWHEREVYDLSGVWFTGHPELTRILLAEDWVGHPLRKDYEFPLEYHGIRGR